MSAEAWGCVRCGADGPRLPKPPFAGPLGTEVAEKVCAACWGEWQRAEVMVINELRLNFMDPAAQEILTTQLRDFLALGPETSP